MEKLLLNYTNIALVKEIESPENPQGLEKRVALIPKDIKELVSHGIKIYVEKGAGVGINFSDEEYIEAGAVIQSSQEIYKNKDMIIKFKGPSLDSISQMKKGCTLFCMAHFHSFPDRAKLLEERQINVIAMEEILESKKEQSDEAILARTGMKEALQGFIEIDSIKDLKIYIIGRNERLAGSIRRAGNRNPYSLQLLKEDVKFEDLEETGKNTLYFYDSSEFKNLDNLIEQLKII